MMAGVRYKNLHKIPLLLTKNVVLLKSSVNQILHLEESCIYTLSSGFSTTTSSSSFEIFSSSSESWVVNGVDSMFSSRKLIKKINIENSVRQ